ncbi:hypothetical protein FB550_10580 [Neobacillus bataviensis]|uniref:Uncharacterized protein n=1 Tax=Neobacillus bataviensis TaxID=220685 RepID=A0A561DE88_9BACI|nr:hypothetical protein [Neobacillus bataviensis]TWE01714.1 hypothetical protein FB550_10580 [Neobacillus bataviensis]
MKKLFTVISGLVIAGSLFVTSGNTAKASECGCDTSPILGAEKNKIVANLISSLEFKEAKQSIKYEGFSWKGVKNIEVIVNHTHDDALMIGVPFYNQDESIEMAVFINGHFMGHNPLEEE